MGPVSPRAPALGVRFSTFPRVGNRETRAKEHAFPRPQSTSKAVRDLPPLHPRSEHPSWIDLRGSGQADGKPKTIEGPVSTRETGRDGSATLASLAQFPSRIEAGREQVLVPDLGLQPAFLRLPLRPLAEDGDGGTEARVATVAALAADRTSRPGLPLRLRLLRELRRSRWSSRPRA